MLSIGVIKLVGKEKKRNTGRARPPSYVGLKLGLFFLMIGQWRQMQNEPCYYIGSGDTFGDGISESNSRRCVTITPVTTALPSVLRVHAWSGGLCFMQGGFARSSLGSLNRR